VREDLFLDRLDPAHVIVELRLDDVIKPPIHFGKAEVDPIDGVHFRGYMIPT